MPIPCFHQASNQVVPPTKQSSNYSTPRTGISYPYIKYRLAPFSFAFCLFYPRAILSPSSFSSPSPSHSPCSQISIINPQSSTTLHPIKATKSCPSEPMSSLHTSPLTLPCTHISPSPPRLLPYKPSSSNNPQQTYP